MIRFRTNGENMKRDVIHNPRMLIGFFSIFFIFGLFVNRSHLQGALPMILFHATLLVNTYFSIECFGPRSPIIASGQGVIDFCLVSMYAITPLYIGSPGAYLICVTLLFLIATLKYTLLLGVITDVRLLRRKISIDISGVLGNFCTFLLVGSGLILPELMLWIWASGFVGLNFYLLKIKPMYCLTAP
jgi:hypothetical protein